MLWVRLFAPDQVFFLSLEAIWHPGFDGNWSSPAETVNDRLDRRVMLNGLI